MVEERPAAVPYRIENDWPEDVNACLALLVDEADAAALARLDGMWKPLPDCPAKRQLNRRLAHGLPAAQAADIGWQHLGAGVRLLAASANVRALARDDKYVYVGHPWGVEVYDPAGEPLTRIALGEPVEALAWAAGAIWAGTPRGLFRIEPGDWTVAHLWLDRDLEPQHRYGRMFPGTGNNYSFDNGVSALVPDGDALWIGLHRNIQRLDTRTMALRAFSLRELHADFQIGVHQIVPDGEYVWADGNAGLLRYDRKTGSWDRVQFGNKPLGLIGVIDGKVLGNAWLNVRLCNRPAIIDRHTLKVTPLLIDAARRDAGQLVNFAFSFYGKRKGQIILGAQGSYQWYAVDDAAGRLCPLFPEGNPGQDPRETAAPLDTVLPERFARTTPRWMLAGRSGDVLIREVGYGDDVVLAAAAGPLVAGRPWRPELSRDTPYPWENRREAGLWFFSPQRHARLVSQSPRADRIGADAVYAVVDDPDGKRRWLATDDGLAVLDADDRVIAVLDRDDGLLANRLTGGARLDGRLYFSAAWGDRGGGLAVFNPQTSVFTGRFVSDGLASDKLAAIAPAGHRLKLFYGVEQSRYGRGGGQFPPGVFDPRTGAVQPNCPPWLSGDGGLGRADSAPGSEPATTAPLSRRTVPRPTASRRQDLSLRRTGTGDLQLRTTAGAGAAGTGRPPRCRSRRQAAGRGQAGPSDDRLAR